MSAPRAVITAGTSERRVVLAREHVGEDPEPDDDEHEEVRGAVTTKKATVRRAMCPVGMPACLSAHTPSARPPAPPLGSSELAASSAIAISIAQAPRICAQNVARNTTM